MTRQKVISAAEAARLIPDDAIVTVSSSSALGCPDAVLKAIGERFDAEGHPRNITTLHPIAAGDMWGVKGSTILPNQVAWRARWRVHIPPARPRLSRPRFGR